MERLLVQWTEFPSSLTGALGQLQRAGELADVTLACEGRHIRAHKLVLSACSPYFRDAFKENPCHHPIIILKDVQAQDVVNLLSYMYRGEVDIEEDELASFVQTAELLQIKGLAAGALSQLDRFTQKPPSTTSPHVKKSTPVRKNANNAPSKDPVVVKTTPSKRRRNSAVEKADSFESENRKKKTVKTDIPVERSDSSPTFSDSDAKPPDIVEIDIDPSIVETEGVEIKHEPEELSEEEETENNDSPEEPPNPPAISYENSMLARSLISGAQILKSDNGSIATPPASSKLAAQLTSGVSRELPVVEECVVKIEKLSPRPDPTQLEPEVLISEREEGGCRNSASVRVQGARVDQAGPSAPFGQTNHAAICGDCPHCGTKYSNQSALKYHVRLMHSDLTNRLCCYLCPRSFTMRDTFKEHMWTSHGQRN